ncbi:DUF2000 family protein [Quadrisphaera sp. DSM 44207]|uniref:DUF2000 family protein n=1 Tax=Quadrisphaera sp. DSM 44207 TaxID=1881057 RepID=UPI000B804B13|nr:DUF2000 family protein [Quadrisphaera sp. DSM 44207]
MTVQIPGPVGVRSAIVLDRQLPAGLAANAAAVLALTLGALEPDLPGPDVPDAAGEVHPGLFPTGLPVLAAAAGDLAPLRARALRAGVRVVDLPAVGQQTTDYEAFCAAVAATAAADLAYAGVLLHGPARAVRSLTGGLPLLR